MEGVGTEIEDEDVIVEREIEVEVKKVAEFEPREQCKHCKACRLGLQDLLIHSV